MINLSVNETSALILETIEDHLMENKDKERYNNFNTIILIDEIDNEKITTYINKKLKDEKFKSTRLFLNKVLEEFLEYIRITIAYKKFRNGLEKLLNVNYKKGIKTLVLIESLDKNDYETEYNIDDLYDENIIYKVLDGVSDYKVVEKGTKHSQRCYACVCSWCKGAGLQKICVFRSDLVECHFILGYVCNDNTEKYIELEEDIHIKSILKKLDTVIKSKHSDINKKRCMNTDCEDKDKRTVIKGREQELKFLKGNFCSKCIKIFNKNRPILRECLKDDCKTTYNYWKQYPSKPYCLPCRKNYFKK